MANKLETKAVKQTNVTQEMIAAAPFHLFMFSKGNVTVAFVKGCFYLQRIDFFASNVDSLVIDYNYTANRILNHEENAVVSKLLLQTLKCLSKQYDNDTLYTPHRSIQIAPNPWMEIVRSSMQVGLGVDIAC